MKLLKWAFGVRYTPSSPQARRLLCAPPAPSMSDLFGPALARELEDFVRRRDEAAGQQASLETNTAPAPASPRTVPRL